MPEIVSNSFCSALVRCFSGLEARNINSFIVIFWARVCAVSKHFIDRLAVIGPLQRETAKFVAVISLFRVREAEEFCGVRRSCRCFFNGITAKTAAPSSGSWDRDPGFGPKGPSRDDASRQLIRP